MDQEVPQVNEPQEMLEEEPVQIVDSDSESEGEPHVVLDIIPENEISKNDWNQMLMMKKFKKEEMDLLVMDFLVNSELTVVAEVFHRESGCPRIEDLSLLETQKTVRDLIDNLHFDEAISFLNEKLGPSFLADRPVIHFLVDQQKMIELCRGDDMKAALEFSRKFVKWEDVKSEDEDYVDFKEQTRRTLVRLLCKDSTVSPSLELMFLDRRSFVSRNVVEEIIKFQGRETGNMIERGMKMLRLDQFELNEKVRFPNFNFDSGFPEPLPHPEGEFEDEYKGIQYHIPFEGFP